MSVDLKSTELLKKNRGFPVLFSDMFKLIFDIKSINESGVGNVGLSSGDFYYDTAANILANGDLILAKKVSRLLCN